MAWCFQRSFSIPWFNPFRLHEAAIVPILQRVMDIIDPPALPEPPKKPIGFQVKESKARYLV